MKTLQMQPRKREGTSWFDLLNAACTESNANLQILVVEHANLPDDRHQSAMIEEPWIGKGVHALIPESWQ